jgi:hypothetical protein
MKTLASLSLLAVLVPGAFASTSRKQAKFNWKDITHVYAFGDSYSFVQGTLGHANYSFIGDAFNVSFTPQEILSNKIVPHNVRTAYPNGCSSQQLMYV